MPTPRVIPYKIHRFNGSESSAKDDLLAVEEPLEIKLGFGQAIDRQQKSLAITMRTPGEDFDLVLGFLFTEGIINSMDDFTYINYCADAREEASENVVRVELSESKKIEWKSIERNFYTNSSCGICGKASIESLEAFSPEPISSDLRVSAKLIHTLGEKISKKQGVFKHTGGVHAAAIFSMDGEILMLREDIGRHNALDKMIGAALQRKMLPLSNSVLMLSGRSSFELLQKSVTAGIPVVCCIGAPSSLAVDTAREYGISLLGFYKGNSFNIYSHPERIQS